MPQFFDFLAAQGYDQPNVDRMNLRFRHVVDPHRSDLDGADVLDLGSHDGRWPFALASAGAKSVLGIEGRADVIERFAAFPATNFKDRVKLVCGNFVGEMDRLIAAGRTFDVVACLGVYYHTVEHYRMLLQMTALKPRLIVIDSIFAREDRPVIVVAREMTDKPVNAVPNMAGQKVAPVGRISVPALRIMAESVGYAVTPVRWAVPIAQRRPVGDYYSKYKDRVRQTLALRPTLG